MTLLFDDRARLPGQPGLHALIAAVGHYPFLAEGPSRRGSLDMGMAADLTSATPTVSRIYHWLTRERSHPGVPLATCRILLSSTQSSGSELDAVEPCTLYNFLRSASEFRRDAATHPSNMIFVYLMGHGIQFGREQLILLEDFYDNIGSLLHNTVDVSNLVNGLAVSGAYPQMARTQLFFFDMSSTTAPGLEQSLMAAHPTLVYDPDPSFVSDDRELWVFFAAEPGKHAYGRPQGLTFFAEAMLRALSGSGAVLQKTHEEPQWVVTPQSLQNAIQNALNKLTADTGLPQPRMRASGTFSGNTPVHYLNYPPVVDLHIEIEPYEAAGSTAVKITNDSGRVVASSGPGEVPIFSLPAGFYSLRASHGDRRTQQSFHATPPETDIVVSVED